ncbi:hypothetical protein L0P88_04115 [Muricauda sp. SCSIO 64092]|uniref:hypothetical protein n=1 Tax=Allomuricauda sp. SCSIO 64092 TaxID=2908842 RepID=UPI001FF110A1|nr:hypothetical protein [Muricauda sp. SCSIO 64092]UOY07740.1 hypothetical protein L0P88_04115 [Muricauda sp. SCSIO 64092]
MESLQIKKEAALTAHENAKAAGKKLLEDLFGKNTFVKDIKERIKSFDDVLEYHQLDKQEFEVECAALSKDEVAYRKLKLIVKALNEGWTPDWGNSNQYKYQPWFNMGGSSGSGFAYLGYGIWHSYSYVGSRLCFKSRELARYAGEQFTDIYKDFFII